MLRHDLTERLLLLRGVPVFKSMKTSELAPLAVSMSSAKFEKGDLLLREGEPPRSLHLLVTGSVTMRRRGHTIRTLAAPGAVGFLSVLARTAGGTDAIADMHTETFEVRSDVIEEMFEDYFSVYLETLHWIAERLVQTNLESPPEAHAPVETTWLGPLVGTHELGIVERIFLLRRSKGFNKSNVNSIARFARRMKEVRVVAGETVWRPGDRADDTVFVIDGELEQRWNHGQMVQPVGRGISLGGAEAIAGFPRWNELVAKEDAVLLRGSKEALIDMLEDDFEVALQFMSTMATRLLELWDRKAEVEAGIFPGGRNASVLVGVSANATS